MTTIDQSGLKGKIRDRPISRELELVLLKAGSAAGVDKIFITSGGQPGSTGRSTGSTRHNGGRAADLRLISRSKTLTFSDVDAHETVKKFVISAAAHGATGIGAAVGYMGPDTLHVGFGLTPSDSSKLVWGAGGRSKNAPGWLRDAAAEGWSDPPSWAFDTDGELAEDLPEEEDAEFGAEEDNDGPVAIPKRFNIDVIRAAEATQRHWGIPASVTLAQWAVESAYGERMPPGSNNPFGIKARPGQPHVLALTTEFVNGKARKVHETFRIFASLEEAFIKHGELLGSAPTYANARKFANEPDRFADALTGIYATDTNYGSLLKSIMRSNNLYAFDSLASEGSSSNGFDQEVNVTKPLQQGDVDLIRVTALQQRLVGLGYKLGEIDGEFGSLTAGALLAFQNDNGLPTTGVLDAATEAALNSAKPRRLDDDRMRATERELAQSGSRIILDARRSRVLSWIAGAFGAFGLGNSAIVNAAGSAATHASAPLPEGLLPFLVRIQELRPDASDADLLQISAAAKTLSGQLTALSLPPEVVQTLDQLRRIIPQEVLSSKPELVSALGTIGEMAGPPPSSLRTVIDVLPTFFANESVLQTAMQGLATVGASVLPGFGGSLTLLGLGLAGRYFANRIAAARVDDHRNGGNINPLEG